MRQVPAAEIEHVVIDQIRALLQTPEIIVETWRADDGIWLVSFMHYGGLIWASTFGIGGYFLGTNLRHFVGPIGWVALAGFAVGSYCIWSFFKSNEKRFMADAECAIATHGVSPSRREIDR